MRRYSAAGFSATRRQTALRLAHNVKSVRLNKTFGPAGRQEGKKTQVIPCCSSEDYAIWENLTLEWKMRCLFVADLHYSLPQFDWLLKAAAGYDLVVLAGDALDIS